jgi:hypothetical protein
MGWAMKEAKAPAERLTQELHRVLDRISGDFDRIEILSVALSCFCEPIPDYDPGFHNLMLPPRRQDSARTQNH